MVARSFRSLGDETLRTIAQELVKTVRANVTIDWTLRVRAQLRVLVKRILRKGGYPPDKQEKRRSPCSSRLPFYPRNRRSHRITRMDYQEAVDRTFEHDLACYREAAQG